MDRDFLLVILSCAYLAAVEPPTAAEEAFAIFCLWWGALRC